MEKLISILNKKSIHPEKDFDLLLKELQNAGLFFDEENGMEQRIIVMNKIINEDAIIVLDRMVKDGENVDLIVTDPPYRVTSRGGYTNAGGMLLNSDVRKGTIFKHNVKIDQWLPLLYEILKDTGHCYIMCNNKNLYPFLDAIKKSEFHLVKTMVWSKNNKTMSQAYMSQIEFILFLRKGKFVKINHCGTSDIFNFPNKKLKDTNNKVIHFTEKPIDLMKVLIENSSKENEIVLDPFLGIGSTAIAAKSLNRFYIGIEIDQKWCELAEKRINDEKNQMNIIFN